jgi:hypothetical protein
MKKKTLTHQLFAKGVTVKLKPSSRHYGEAEDFVVKEDNGRGAVLVTVNHKTYMVLVEDIQTVA